MNLSIENLSQSKMREEKSYLGNESLCRTILSFDMRFLFLSFFFLELSSLYKINPHLFPRKKIILDNLDAPEKIIFRGG